ncbi:NifB/NifX family molybdenum-iron cluster-binding protein [Desulfurobacterium sp.]|uniref:NifB/NifX family molybdenum-iron cluster-binding protein n=1 Tax=Desulfurobacterium sp. TaxID=2004706 RepID=UPI00261B1C44|nr:NifB/NifX family molybdenum-iron cluster-binding protein [Desulfurobacterium sp.]
MKIAVPVTEDRREAEVTEFGRAPFFAIIEENNVKFVKNPGSEASSGAGVKASQFIINGGVEKVILKKPAGPHASSALEQAGIEVEVREGLRTLNEVL